MDYNLTILFSRFKPSNTLPFFKFSSPSLVSRLYRVVNSYSNRTSISNHIRYSPYYFSVKEPGHTSCKGALRNYSKRAILGRGMVRKLTYNTPLLCLSRFFFSRWLIFFSLSLRFRLSLSFLAYNRSYVRHPLCFRLGSVLCLSSTLGVNFFGKLQVPYGLLIVLPPKLYG